MVGKHGDYVPFMGPQIHDHALTVARVPARKFYWDPDILVSTQMAVERWYGFDAYTIISDAYNTEIEALGAKMIYSDEAMPTVDTNTPLIRERGDLDKIGPLDVTKARVPLTVELCRLITERIKGPFSMGFFCSPFSFLCNAMGYPRAVKALLRDKAYARELFDYAENEVIFPFLKAQAGAGVKSSVGADAWSAFPNLTPGLVLEWIVPSARRLAERPLCSRQHSRAARRQDPPVDRDHGPRRPSALLHWQRARRHSPGKYPYGGAGGAHPGPLSHCRRSFFHRDRCAFIPAL